MGNMVTVTIASMLQNNNYDDDDDDDNIDDNDDNKLGCASVKLLVWLKFTKAILYFIRICFRCSQEATFTVSLKSGQ